jgi:hypothetical protein
LVVGWLSRGYPINGSVSGFVMVHT